MSLVFKPKLPAGYVRGTPTKSTRLKRPKTNGSPWTPQDVERLLELRVIGVSYNDIGKLLKRSPATCTWIVHDRDLGLTINNLRNTTIADIMLAIETGET
jgi:hypothetical protein